MMKKFAVFLLLVTCITSQDANADRFLVRKKNAAEEAIGSRAQAMSKIAAVQAAGEPMSIQNAQTYISELEKVGTATLPQVATIASVPGAVGEPLGIAHAMIVNSPTETADQLSTRLGPQYDVVQVGDEPMINLPPAEEGSGAIASAQIASVTNWGIAKIRAQQARAAFSVSGAGVKVAVIDTGVNANHPSISANVDRSLSKAFRPDAQNPLSDEHGHGTHVAGVIASTDTSISVAPGAQIVALKVTDAAGNANVLDMHRALEYAITNRCQVVNISMGAVGSQQQIQETWADLFAAAHEAGITVCVASGNEGPNGPVRSPGSVFGSDPKRYGVAVGATTVSDSIASFSAGNGQRPDVLAPGDAIVSLGSAGGTRVFSGTSQATPHVAGLMALAYSLPQSTRKTPDKYRDLLKSSATGISGPPQRIGSGRIDAVAFLTAVDGPGNVPPVPGGGPGVSPEEHKQNIATLNTILDFWKARNAIPAAPKADDKKPEGEGKKEISKPEQPESELKLIRETLLQMAIERGEEKVEDLTKLTEDADRELTKAQNAANGLDEAAINSSREAAEKTLKDPAVTEASQIEQARKILREADDNAAKVKVMKDAASKAKDVQEKRVKAEADLAKLKAAQQGK